MEGYRSICLLLAGVLLLAGPLAGPLAAQETAAAEEIPAEEEEALDLDRLLAGEEEILAGLGFTYDPGNRRDPFRSLLAARERQALKGPRPDGIPGLLIDEVDLSGVFVTPEGPVAQVQSSDRGRSFLLHVGDQLYDGDVVRITNDEVVFKQLVDDPTALKPFREVVKRLSP